MMAPTPAQRPQTTQEILRAIAHLERELIPGHRRRELAWALLGSVLVASLVWGAVAWDGYNRYVIGLDLYRDFSVHPNVPELAQKLGMSGLVKICKSVPGGSASRAPQAKAWVVGFSDLLKDTDRILRRQVLAMPSPPGSPCPDAIFSFNTQIVFSYLTMIRYILFSMMRKNLY